MKSIIIALLGVAAAHQLHSRGIDKDDLMQNQPSHWRKVWPQGVIDNSEGDSEVLDMFNTPEKHEKKVQKETYPWELAKEVIDTNESIATAEKSTGKKLSAEGVKQRGLDMIYHYDNTKRVFERNTPHGNDWYNAETLSNH